MGLGLDKIASVLSDMIPEPRIALEPYSFGDVQVFIGAPLTPLFGLDYVAARHVNPQAKRFQCLTGRGVYAHNVNSAGIVEIGMLRGSPAQAIIDLMQASGVPYPLTVQDVRSGGTSQVMATGCQLTETPEWKREALPGVNIYRFETTRLFVMHGMQLPYVVV